LERDRDREPEREREREGEGEARRRWLLRAAPASPSEASDTDTGMAAAAGRFGAMPARVGRSWFRVLDLNPPAGLLRLADMAVGLLLCCRGLGLGVGGLGGQITFIFIFFSKTKPIRNKYGVDIPIISKTMVLNRKIHR
jgi:hypothetical protein